MFNERLGKILKINKKKKIILFYLKYEFYNKDKF